MVKIVGILNITPDSFSDGGKYNDHKLAIKQADRMIEDGVDIIDIGGESTRPDATPIDALTELSRLKPTLQDLVCLAHNNNIEVSIDTYKPQVAEFAISCGVDFINDVTGFVNPEMVSLAVDTKKRIIVTHNLWALQNRGIKQNSEHIDEILHWAEMIIVNLTEQGVRKSDIIIDPGIGFGKTNSQSWDIINNIKKLHILGTDLYVGHSRKRFLGKEDSREAYTLAVSTMLALNKIHYIRVHNVGLHKALFKQMF